MGILIGVITTIMVVMVIMYVGHRQQIKQRDEDNAKRLQRERNTTKDIVNDLTDSDARKRLRDKYTRD